jgi:hypothetical protein
MFSSRCQCNAFLTDIAAVQSLFQPPLPCLPLKKAEANGKSLAIVESDVEDVSPAAGLSQTFNPGSLSALGIKNMETLTSQFPNGPKARGCPMCSKRMDCWTIKGQENVARRFHLLILPHPL